MNLEAIPVVKKWRKYKNTDVVMFINIYNQYVL